MDLKLCILYLVVSLAYTYEHKLIISKRLHLTQCEEVNKTVYSCSFLYQAFQQLSTCCNSTDIIIVDSKSHTLNASFTFKYLTEIRLRSHSYSVPAEIKCTPSINETNAGLAFIGVKNLSIEYQDVE